MIVRKIAYNVVFSAASKVLSIALAFVGIGYTTRYLGESGFGDYATVVAFFSFFGAFADLGLYSVATREISRDKADSEVIMGNVFTLRILSSFLLLLVVSLVVWFLPYSQEVKVGILLSVVAFVFSSGYMVLNGVFQKNLAMDKVAMVEFFGKAIQVGIIIFSVRNDLGFKAIVLAMVVAMFSNFVLVFLFSRRYLRFKLRIDPFYWKKFLKMSLPMGMSAIITFLYFKMDTIILSFMQGSQDVGIYNAAYKVIENITFFPAMIVGLTLPLTSRFIFSDKKKFFKLSDKTFKIFVLLIIPIVVGILFLANEIILLIGGKDGFVDSVGVLRVLAFALLFLFFGNFFNNILLAGNLQKKLMKTLFFCAVFNICANLVFIPNYSYMAAAIISVVTEGLVVLLTASLTIKYLKYTPKINKLMEIFVAAGIMALFLYVFSWLNFFLLVVFGAVIYFGCLYLLKVISKEEVFSVIRR